MSGKRIMQVVYSLGVGGSEIVARDIALGLKGRGWPNAVCALECGGSLQHELEQAGVETFVAGRKAGVLGTMFKVYQAIRKFKPDVVHTHHLYELFYAWPGALIVGADIVHTEHECNSLRSMCKRFTLKALSILCKYITAVNEETVKFLAENTFLSNGRIMLVRNGVSIARMSKVGGGRSSLGLDMHIPVVGIVARLEPEKDHATLLRAFAEVLREVPGALLLVVGDGSCKRGLELLAESLGINAHVHFVGVRMDIPVLVNAMDVIVLSSSSEGLPLCLLEAMAAKKAIVSTDVGGVSKLICHGKSGLIVQVGDISGMANSIVRLLKDKNLRHIIGLEGFSVVSEKYDVDETVACYVDIYTKCRLFGRKRSL